MLKTMMFSDGAISDTGPLPPARFEERGDASSFIDASGDERAMSCSAATSACPTAGERPLWECPPVRRQRHGEHGRRVTELAKGSFTIAAWVNTTGAGEGSSPRATAT